MLLLSGYPALKTEMWFLVNIHGTFSHVAQHIILSLWTLRAGVISCLSGCLWLVHCEHFRWHFPSFEKPDCVTEFPSPTTCSSGPFVPGCVSCSLPHLSEINYLFAGSFSVSPMQVLWEQGLCLPFHQRLEHTADYLFLEAGSHESRPQSCFITDDDLEFLNPSSPLPKGWVHSCVSSSLV